MIDLDAIGRDLVAAHALRLQRTHKRRRALRTAGLTLAVACAFAAAAAASDIGPDLQLDPTKWTILGHGSTDRGGLSRDHRKQSRGDRRAVPPMCGTPARPVRFGRDRSLRSQA